MLKIMPPPDISFYKEHQKIIDESEYVLFCWFGKTNILTSAISRDGNLFFVKETIKNGNKNYVMNFLEIKEEKPKQTILIIIIC